MIFEGGWGPNGAVCLSHARWLTSLGGLFANVCPNGRLIPPGLGGLACNSLLDVLFIDPSVRMFNEIVFESSIWVASWVLEQAFDLGRWSAELIGNVLSCRLPDRSGGPVSERT